MVKIEHTSLLHCMTAPVLPKYKFYILIIKMEHNVVIRMFLLRCRIAPLLRNMLSLIVTYSYFISIALFENNSVAYRKINF